MTGSTRIIVNTLASYIRLLALGMAGIISTPIVLRRLGAADFGIFTVIGGSLTMLMFVNVALTGGAQRHIAFSLGEKKIAEARSWFAASLLVHAVMAAALAVVALACAPWFLADLLRLPASRFGAATWIYRMIVAAMVCNVASTPYQALLMAYEKIVSLTLMCVASALLLLGGVISLPWLRGDGLLWYAAIYSTSQMFMYVSPIIYCIAIYPEHRRVVVAGRRHVKELLTFSGWNLFGALAGLVRGQGPAVLLSMFVGPLANAAYGVGLQINAFATNVSGGVLRATTPAIVKHWAAGDHQRMERLSNFSNGSAFIILWMVTGPLLLETSFCLRLWLHNVPPCTAICATFLLISLLIDQLTLGFAASVQATGKIAGYQIWIGATTFSAVPAGYLLLRAGMSVPAVMQAVLGSTIVGGVCRLWFARREARIPFLAWLRNVFYPCTASVAGSAVPIWLVMHAMHPGMLRLALVTLLDMVVSGLLFWHLGVAEEHRRRIGEFGVQIRTFLTGTSRRLATSSSLAP